MAVEAADGDLLHVVVLLGAAVVAVPLFKTFRSRLDSGLFGCGAGYRTLRIKAHYRFPRYFAYCGIRRGDVSVFDRAGNEAVAFMEIA